MNAYFRKGLFLAIIMFSFLAVFSGVSVQNATSAQNCVEPPSGLVSWWDGDSVSRTGPTNFNVKDIKGNNDGILYDRNDTNPGKVGNAFNLGTTVSGRNTASGGNEHVSIKNSASLNFGTGSFSLEAWFYWYPQRAYPTYTTDIIRKSNYPVSGLGAGYWLRIVGEGDPNTKGKLEFFVGETSGAEDHSRGTIITLVNPNTWHHVIGTRDDSGTMKLYLDGALKETKEVPGANTTSPAVFNIGAWNDRFGGQEFFFGLIDEVSVYNKALSQSEVKNIFNAGSAGKCKPSITPEPTTPPVSVSPTPSKTPVPLSDIVYPIAELGNCANQQECKTYCSVTSNYSKCATFAKKNNLSVLVPAVYTAMEKGESPGKCKDEVSCRVYCEDIEHIEECVGFVEKFKLASGDELKEIRQMVSIKKSGVAFPGNCKTKESCFKYCESPANAVVCTEFALKAGFIPKEDTEAVGKILLYLKSGGKMPSGCTRKESCDAYCADDAHINECMDFAAGAGFMTKEETEIIRKTGGKGPGNCKSREACENYCEDEKHIDECVDFAVKAGFISKEDAEMAKKFKITSGPGGCKGKAECESFCVTNQDICIKWGKEHGIDMGGGQGGPGTAEECAKYGGNWDGKKCELGASECVKQGGSWGPDKETDKETCNFGGDMGPDIRKELEACLGKKTCAEFNSCFDSLPKGNQQQGPGQSSGQGQQQGSQDENGKKIEARARACLDEKMDSCLVLSCSEFEGCLKSLQQGSGGQGTGDQESGQSQENPKFNAKMKACQEEIKAIKMKEVQAKQTACLSRSCSEFESCLKALQPSDGDQGGQQQQQGQGEPDTAVGAKIQACQKEKVNLCLSKPCGEFQACMNSLGGGGGDQGGQQQGASDPAVESKFKTCFSPPPQGESGGGQYPFLLLYSPFTAIINFILGPLK